MCTALLIGRTIEQGNTYFRSYEKEICQSLSVLQVNPTLRQHSVTLKTSDHDHRERDENIQAVEFKLSKEHNKGLFPSWGVLRVCWTIRRQGSCDRPNQRTNRARLRQTSGLRNSCEGLSLSWIWSDSSTVSFRVEVLRTLSPAWTTRDQQLLPSLPLPAAPHCNTCCNYSVFLKWVTMREHSCWCTCLWVWSSLVYNIHANYSR